MTFKKNWFGYLLWALYVFAAVAYHAGLVYVLTDIIPAADTPARIGIVCLSFVLAAGIFALTRRVTGALRDRGTGSGQRTAAIVWEAFLAVLILGAGLFLRIFFFGSAGEEAAYFETAMVTGEALTPIAHGSEYIYVLLLRGLFWLAGNYFSAGIILQIFLQTAAAVIWYLFVRRMAGPAASIVFLAGVMLFPQSIAEGLTYSSRMLYILLCGMALLMVSRVLKRQAEGGRLKWYSVLHAVLTGAAIGLLIYLDVPGLTLLLPLLFVFFVQKKGETGEAQNNAGRAALLLFTVLLFSALSMVAAMAVNGMQSGSGFVRVWEAWRTMYASKGQGRFVQMLMPVSVLEKCLMTAVSFLLVLGIPAFFNRRRTESQMPVFLLLFGACCIQGDWLMVRETDCEYLIFSLVLALAGADVQALLVRDKASAKEKGPTQEKEPAWEKVTAQEVAPGKAEAPAQEVAAEKEEKPVQEVAPGKAETPAQVEAPEKAEAPAQEVAPGKAEAPAQEAMPEAVAALSAKTEAKPPERKPVKYIENPLPLPKKHVKKIMDYPRKPQANEMEFDIEVPDDDDFDIV